MSKNPTGRSIASLDGLRSVSLLLVVLGHLYGTQGYPNNRFTEFLGRFAHLGVQIFFVISGFLITSLLVKEREKTGTIDLVAFFTRRTLRIFPAAFFYITVVAILFHPGFLWYAYTYTMCYLQQGRPWVLGHLWSLSVEEQFYLLWPTALFFAYRHHTKIAVSIVLFAIVARLTYWMLRLPVIYEYFPAVADNLMMGCLLAFHRDKLRIWTGGRLTHPISFGLLGILTVVSPFLLPRVRLQIALGGVIPFIIALFMFAAVERRDWLLNNRITSTIGILSYSLYLWQEPFLNRFHAAWWTRFPVNILLLTLCAIASFFLVENRLLDAYKKRASRSGFPMYVAKASE
jgi:peptidoglycan/LPS O-acetylase OafA/YrhL